MHAFRTSYLKCTKLFVLWSLMKRLGFCVRRSQWYGFLPKHLKQTLFSPTVVLMIPAEPSRWDAHCQHCNLESSCPHRNSTRPSIPCSANAATPPELSELSDHLPLHDARTTGDLSNCLGRSQSWRGKMNTWTMATFQAPRRCLITAINAIVFGFCDLADTLLCPVFRYLDRHLDKNASPPCHCTSPHATGSYEALEFWTGPSHTLYQRQKKWGGRKARLQSGDDDDAVAGKVVRRWKTTTTRSPEKRRARNATSWSDCGCATCTAWLTRENLLYVHADYQDFAVGNGEDVEEAAAVHNVIFLHGFLSSSSFWVDTVLPRLSKEVRSSHRLFAVDVLGFGRSPRPEDCLYTNAEHVDMIRRSVLEKYGIRRFHLVAHSMGCTIALALAGQDPAAVKSITIVAPLYFPTRPGVAPASYVLSNVAPQKIWPFFAFVHALMSWYEHLGRVVCLVFCKHHRFWIPLMTFISKLLGSRMPPSFIHDYMQHSHSSAFKMFHNTICAGPFVMEHSMAELAKAGRHVHVIHGEDDVTCSVECGVALGRKFANVTMSVIVRADHMSVVLGREQELAKELESQILGHQYM